MEPELSLDSILSTLTSKTSSKEEKVEAYKQITLKFKEDENCVTALHTSDKSKKLFSSFQKDITEVDGKICQAALQVLGFYLHSSECIRHLSVSECKSILTAICNCVEKAEDKVTCTRSLWCLYHQCLPVDILCAEVNAILSAVENALTKWKSQSTTVEFESCHVISCLLKQCRKEMNSKVPQWSKLLFPLIVHGAVKVREVAFDLISKELSTLVSHQKEINAYLVEDSKSKICPEMKKLFSVGHQEMYVLRCWETLVQICGEELHHGSFINHLLPIVELGFKSSSTEVKVEAFNAWQHLIDNFALNPDILTDPKRVKLIMQVFKINNTKIESAALSKVRVWWHFIWLLGPKASAYFEQVCLPLLRFCVGGSQGGATTPGTPRMLKTGTSPITPRLNLSTPSNSPQMAKFPSVQLKGCEALAHFLGSVPKDMDVPHYSFTLDSLNHDIITGPAFFVKHASILITSVTELMCSVGKDIPEGLLFRMWYSLVAHLKNGLDTGVRTELRGIFTTFLSQFQILVLSQSLQHNIILKMFHAVCCLPRKALSSTACNVSSGENMHGTPALFLTELLLTPTLLKSCCSMESYICLYGNLVNSGLGHSGTLEYCQSLIDLLTRNVQFVDSAETVWRLWSSVATPLYEYVNKTGEVNQGDALEHNFGCLYTVLQFPILHRLPAKMPQVKARRIMNPLAYLLRQATVKTLMKTWSDIYRMFARLAALVTNAEANICCEHVCHNILKSTTGEDYQNELYLDSLIQLCLVVVNAVDFSSLGSGGAFNMNGLSPAKWVKKKQKPMENIHSMTVLVSQLLESLTGQIASSAKTMKSDGTLQGPANNVIEILTTLFTHISSSAVLSAVIGHLSQPISALYHDSASKVSSKIYNNFFMQKLEKLWLDVSTSIQSRYGGLYETEFLENVSPLLESTFLHPRRAIKNQTIILWNATFRKATHLEYPEKIRPVLAKVKEKTQIHLPGWNASNVQIIAETPLSQMSQAESQAPEPHIPGMPSPRKLHGSLINKNVSPKILKSPIRSVVKETRSPSSAKKQILPFNGTKNDDFVVIKSPPKKKRVLTEHQKEVFKEKRVFPAMYNSLDLSQDVSMMSQFNSDTQQETHTPTPDSNIIFGTAQNSSLVKNVLPISNGVSEKNEEKVADKMTSELKTKARRRSVRFMDKEDDSQKSSKANSDKKSLEEFNVTWDKALSSADEEALLACDGTSVKSDDGIDHFKVIKEAIGDPPSIDKSSASVKSSSSSTWEEYVVPQNVMQAVDMESLSVKTSSESNGSLKETEKSGNITSQESEGGSQKSQPLLNWSNQLKELSQSSPKINKSSKLFTSPLKSAKTKQSPGKNKNKVATEKSSCGNLDKWLVKPKDKAPSQEDMEVDGTPMLASATEDSGVNSATVVEETLSPTKFGRSSQKSDPLVAMPPILETPPRPYSEDSQGSNSNNKGSIRKLFTTNDDPPVLDVIEDSNIIPASPESRKTTFPVQVATPVLKLKKLTDDEIRQYSPSQKDENAEYGTPRSQKRESKSSTADRNIFDELSHEHDDFSEIKPIEEGTALSSQGFDAMGTDKYDQKTLGKVEIPSDRSEKGKERETSQEKTESQAPSADNGKAMEIETYDPTITSTYSKHSGPPKLFGTDNLKSSASSSDSTSESSQSQGNPTPSTNETYDPKQESTIVPELGTPGRGRKRKQEMPKKLSPESTRPKRMRKSKYSRDNSSQEESEHEVDEKAKTPGKGGKSDKQGEKKSVSSSQEATKEDQSAIPCGDVGTEESGSVSDLSLKQKDSDVMIKSESEPSDQIKETRDAKKKVSEITVRGEKTPESRTTNSTPQRKSTTKKKKEVAQRRLRVMDRSNPDSPDPVFSSSIEDAPVVQAVQNLEEKMIQNVESQGKENSMTKVDKKSSDSDDDIDVPLSALKKGHNESNTSDASTDDNVPLVKLRKESKEMIDDKVEDEKKDDCDNKMISQTDSDEEENNKNLQNSPTKKDAVMHETAHRKMKVSSCKTSPLSNRLRSSGRVLRTRGKALRRSTSPLSGAKSLKLKKSLRRKTIESVSRSDETDGNDVIENNSLKSNDQEQKENETSSCVSVSTESVEDKDLKSVETDTAVNKVSVTDDNEIDNTKDASDSQVVESELLPVSDAEKPPKRESEKPIKTSKEDSMDETPRKTPDVKTARGAFALFERHSDSKLVTVSRKFEKRLVARRSILKPGISATGYEHASPIRKQSTRFHPIRPGHIFSPAASPSASILKRRRLSGDVATNSPSPPSKQRRVSFAEPLTVEQEQGGEANAMVSDEKSESQVFSSVGSSCTSSATPPTQRTLDSYRSTQESQLSTTDPVYPKLVKCSESVEKVLPQLTSSMWARGLGQLVRARNIHTIGDLSALTEKEIHNLPIRSPKVSNVRRVLKCYEGQQEGKKNKQKPDSSLAIEKDKEDTVTKADKKAVIENKTDDSDTPGTELEVTQLSPIKAQENEEFDSNVGELLNNSADLLDEVSKFTSDVAESISQSNSSCSLLSLQSNLFKGQMTEESEQNFESECTPGIKDSQGDSKKLLTDTFSEMVERCSAENLQQLKTQELFDIHHHLVTLTNAVVSAMKIRCHSSGHSQS